MAATLVSSAFNDGETAGFCHFERSEKSTQMDSSPTAQNDKAHGALLFKSNAKSPLRLFIKEKASEKAKPKAA